MSKRLAAEQVNIKFNLDGSKLSVMINTPRLCIRSVTAEDADNYFKLFSDEDVMAKYATGKPNRDQEAIRKRISEWADRFEKNDPFSGLAVFDRRTNEFIGHIVLGRSDEGNGVSELAYLFHKKFWHKDIGTEAISAIVNHYALEVFKKKYMLDGHKFIKITATTRTDHEYSKKILETVGLTTDKQVNFKFGAQRYIYNASISKLLHQNKLSQSEPIIKYGVKALISGIGLFVAYKIATSGPTNQSNQLKL